VLDRGSVERVADLRKQCLAVAAIVVEDADLDELVRAKIDVDLVQNGRREAVVTDADDRIQAMRLRAELAPFA
jgi:hypothetical protein